MKNNDDIWSTLNIMQCIVKTHIAKKHIYFARLHESFAISSYACVYRPFVVAFRECKKQSLAKTLQEMKIEEQNWKNILENELNVVEDSSPVQLTRVTAFYPVCQDYIFPVLSCISRMSTHTDTHTHIYIYNDVHMYTYTANTVVCHNIC